MKIINSIRNREAKFINLPGGVETELSEPRPGGAQVVKPTHDFLSLYSPAHQDPAPSIPGDYLKTQDFLQPLEQDGSYVSKEGEYIEKSKYFFPPSPQNMVEHILPGGIEAYNYSINQISYINQIQGQKVQKPEGVEISSLAAQSSSSNNNDEYSNCSSYTESGFMLLEDSIVNKGQTGKENIGITRNTMREVMKIGVPSQASSLHNHPSTTFTSLPSSHPLSAPKNHYFAAKSVQEEEANNEEFIIKKELSFHHNGDSANCNQKPNSPRSKHSATEQRRRSKINDRFSMLRGIIPHGDQKRDKASFLSEVIEYIRFLQDKVQKYEDSSQQWSNKPPKTNPLDNRPTNGFIDQPLLPTRHNQLDSNTACSIDATKHIQPKNKPSPFHDTMTMGPKAQPLLSHSSACKTDCTIISDKLKDEELIIESGTISISTIYSQGLSSALTQALKSSGVDLSQANISVQIDLGKTSNTNTLDSSPHNLKENETPSVQQAMACSRPASTWKEESGEGFKRLKTGRK